MDKPKNALDMITRFTRNQALHTAGPTAPQPRGSVRRQPATRHTLPGATWQLRRAMPDHEAGLHAAEE